MQEQESRTYPIREDMRFQKRSWITERIAWVVIIALPVIALSGLFTHGPLSDRITVSGDTLAVTYERFQRVTRQVQFKINVSAADSEATLRIGPQFAERYEITAIEPTPLKSSNGVNGLELSFATPPSGPLTVVIWTHPRKIGSRTFEVALGDVSVSFWTLVYP